MCGCRIMRSDVIPCELSHKTASTALEFTRPRVTVLHN
ncbi:unnamed protein product, partial [Anisakis simplex]|uniref:ZnF_CDGSH domain-containing protein n=1 Tax=Anisakis simplex TaxID=6269 RepID=A0A0M3JM52_ANISI